MAVFRLDRHEATADDMAGELERVANMLCDGFTSGDVANGGWWSVTDLADETETQED